MIVRPPLFRGPIRKVLDRVGDLIDARSLATRLDVDVRDVQIDCGNVGTTQFDLSKSEIAELVEAGRVAVTRFQELSLPQDAGPARPTPTDSEQRASRARHSTLLKTGRLIDLASDTVEIFAGDLSWLENLAPYLLNAHRRGVRSRLITMTSESALLETARRLGVSVGLSPRPQPLRATMVDGLLSSAQIVVVEKTSPMSPIQMSATEAPRVIRHFTTFFSQLWAECIVSDAHEPILRRLNLTEIEHGLRRVSQYSCARVAVEELSVVSVFPTSAFVETFKLDRIRHVQALYSHIDSEKGYHIHGTTMFSIWPVVERRVDGQLVVIDGTHRFYDAYVSGKSTVWALVINGCTTDLPAATIDNWDSVRLTTAKLRRNQRFRAYDARHFREIKSVLSSWFSER